jgi:creatinine amidohydrolase
MSASAQPDFSGLQLELLRPHEIRAAVNDHPLIYLPLGTIEWHCEHLPVGLDALTAHGVCLRAALRTGGLVYPPLHFGTGGGHGDYPWTVMMSDDFAIASLLTAALPRLQSFGVRSAVLFTGHFANEQIAMIRRIASDWNHAGHAMEVLALAMNGADESPIPPDHAGIFETTLLHALWPNRVDVGRLQRRVAGAGTVDEDEWGPQRHQSGHPLWGVVGPDPRDFDPAKGPALLAAIVDWVVAQVMRSCELR